MDNPTCQLLNGEKIVDPTIAELTLSVYAHCAITVTVVVATLAARGHHIGLPGQFVGIASGVTGLGLSGVAVLASSATLPIVAGGAIGAGLIGGGLGWVLSETVKALPAGND
ncbi:MULTISPECIES: hypothetical protein [Dietzia]|uniref:hypothetical protein n=1 Tax=Dietzia TaxID=37914 RepID=UPI000AF9DE75|nr:MULTISPECIES: hypothetical protein [Dietzia]MCT1711512.1 hypothetical protein [Dietzia cinnamea]